MPGPTRSLTPTQWQEAQVLADRGWSLDRIASWFGVSVTFLKKGVVPFPREIRGKARAAALEELRR